MPTKRKAGRLPRGAFLASLLKSQAKGRASCGLRERTSTPPKRASLNPKGEPSRSSRSLASMLESFLLTKSRSVTPIHPCNRPQQSEGRRKRAGGDKGGDGKRMREEGREARRKTSWLLSQTGIKRTTRSTGEQPRGTATDLQTEEPTRNRIQRPTRGPRKGEIQG
jgi:hypothetical protein